MSSQSSVVATETVSQNNCGGTEKVENEVRRARSIKRELSTEGGFAVNASGDVKILGTGVGLGAQVAGALGLTYGEEERIERAITVSAALGTHVEHLIAQREVWQSGSAVVAIGQISQTIEFRFRSDFALELIQSTQIPCSTPTPEMTSAEPTDALVASSRPIDTSTPTASAILAPTETDTIAPTSTNTVSPIATDTAAPTGTNTASPTATDTAAPTNTNTAEPTNTPSPPTATPTPTLSPTPVEPRLGEVRAYVGVDFVYVPPGEFRMGSNDQEVQRAIDLCRSYPDDGGGECSTKFEDERPTRNVYTNAYWIMRTEVTNAQFAEFVNAGGYVDSQYWSSEGWSWRSQEGITEPGYWRNDAVNQANYPVVGISWFEAEAYVNWLQKQTGIPVRLPTEEEWEKAARGTDGRLFPWGDSWSYGRANFCDSRCTLYEWADQNTDDGYAFTAPVGSYPSGASPYGALDMSGNVWEWVSNRARKGGSWTNDPEVLRTPERLQDERYTRPKNVEFPSKAGTGFRLAITYTLGQ